MRLADTGKTINCVLLIVVLSTELSLFYNYTWNEK